MAIRNIRIEGDPILRKVCREVPEITDRIKVLLDDMRETMYSADGVGLAAPQVGILKRIIVVDPRDEETGLVKLVNPEIVESDGEQIGVEAVYLYQIIMLLLKDQNMLKLNILMKMVMKKFGMLMVSQQ